MKFVILLAFVAVAVATETYDTEHDDLDIAAVVANDVTLKSYNDCFIDAGSCDEVQSSFKKDLAEAIKEACQKCTAAQKSILYTYITGLQKKNPEAFTQFKNKYDPEDKYFAPLTAAIQPTNA